MTQIYYGTKKVLAWEQDATSEDADEEIVIDEGYTVKSEDGSQTWWPKAVFEKAFQPASALSFGHAIEAMKNGKGLGRAGWNVDGSVKIQYPDASSKMTLPYFYITRWVKGLNHRPNDPLENKVSPWHPSQPDMLANDWQIVV